MTHFFFLFSFFLSSLLLYFSTMVSNYRTLVGWLKIIDWKKISISPSWSIRGTESEFICRSGRKWKNVGISGVSAGTQ